MDIISKIRQSEKGHTLYDNFPGRVVATPTFITGLKSGFSPRYSSALPRFGELEFWRERDGPVLEGT